MVKPIVEIADYGALFTEIVSRVDEILANGADPERQHADEDQLLRDLIEAFVPAQIKAEIKRLADADFPRWGA